MPRKREPKPIAPSAAKKKAAVVPAVASELVILTGLSGSGKASALKAFEDLGFYAVDNMPLELIPAFADLVRQSAEINRAALVVDVREGQHLDRFPAILRKVRKVLSTTVVFLDAADPSLVRRFSETRRPHPLGRTETVIRAIHAERKLLAPIRNLADMIVDTTRLNVHELRAHILQKFERGDTDKNLLVSSISFGYKNGVPLEADLVFDVRFLPNPHFVPEFRDLTGRRSQGGKIHPRIPPDLRVSGPGYAVVALPVAPLHRGGQKLSHRGIRLHRGPASFGDDRRGSPKAAGQGRVPGKNSPPGHASLNWCGCGQVGTDFGPQMNTAAGYPERVG